jgi:hypothetical protein
LTSEPTATVEIMFSSADSSECLAPGPVLLDATNWLSGALATVVAVDDQLDDGDQPCHIALTTASTDLNYHQRVISDTLFIVQDNDLVTLESAAWSDSPMAQLGEPVTYTYRITNTGDVTLTVQAIDSKLGPVTFASNQIAPKQMTEGTVHYVIRETDAPGPQQSTVTITGTAALGTVVTSTTATEVAIVVMPQIDIRLVRLSPPLITDGSIVTYGLSITNAGFVEAIVESIEGAPTPLKMEGALSNTTCTAPITIMPQSTHQCLIIWQALKTGSDAIEYKVTVKVSGPLQSSAVLDDSAIVVISGPTEAIQRLYLPIIKR